MKITVITVSAPAVRDLAGAAGKIRGMDAQALQLNLYYASVELPWERLRTMEEDIAQADAVFFDLMGASPSVVDAVERGCQRCGGQIIPYGASPRHHMRLGSFTMQSMEQRRSDAAPSMEQMKKMQSMAKTMGKILPGKMRDMRNYSLLSDYFKHSTPENMLHLLILLLTEYGKVKGLPAAKPPVQPLPIALYTLPEREQFTDVAAYAQHCGHQEGKPNVLLLFSAKAYPTENKTAVAELVRALSRKHNVFAVGTAERFSETEGELRRICNEIPNGVDAILNCSPFRLAAGPMGGPAERGIQFLQNMDVPYLHPFFLTRRTKQEWMDAVPGCTPTETMLSVMLPELDGATDTFPVGAVAALEPDPTCDVETYEIVPIDERVERLAARVNRQITLKRKPNSEKRVAIICYNYPPGEANLFGGAFLDTFKSVEAILKRLQQEGYTVEPMTAEKLQTIFTAGRAVNSGKYELNWADAIWFDAAKYRAPEEITQRYGEKPGKIMEKDGAFFIPGTLSGNVFIGLQPARGRGEGDEVSYHDKSLPPHHQYAAFYQWVREEFEADVLLHVGTHGTLEFLKGKECGMSGGCYPDLLVSDLPHLYLYYCGNPAEAVIAKRRSHANLISYQPPVFEECGLYGDFLELETLLDSWHQSQSLSPESEKDALEQALAKAQTLGFSEDPEEIESELYRMRHGLAPMGLHVFGQAYTPQELDAYRSALEKRSAGAGHNGAEEAARAAEKAEKNHEMDGLIHALQGGYNTPRLGGDIFRNPEVLPTGYNLYQFDPRLVPSKAAMERGRRIAENTLAAYREAHGCWPRSTAVILWGLETSRTQGETIGQILGYLGVRLAADSSLWDQHFEPIPLEELGRPRIDVTVNICGLFRDMFPILIEKLDDVFTMIGQLEEPEDSNYFKVNSRLRQKQLLDAGFSGEEAAQLAAVRLFGPAQGEYGTDLTGLVEGRSWETEEQLGATFTANLNYAYSRALHGKRVDGLYEDNLKQVEVVSQLRSSNEYEITDLDHYYEFFGGLAKSVELARGQKAEMYITDVTGNTPITETVDRSIARGLRTRLLNPKWIDRMLEHKHHGAQEIADRFENIMGLTALTGAVDPRFYDELEACYVKNEELRRRVQTNNPHAYMQILERMREYYDRGYWKADKAQLDRIGRACLEAEGKIEDTFLE